MPDGQPQQVRCLIRGAISILEPLNCHPVATKQWMAMRAIAIDRIWPEGGGVHKEYMWEKMQGAC